MTGAARLGLAAVLLVAGGVVGLASAVSHPRPLGLSLAVLGSAAALAALPGGPATRLPFALGWDAVVVRASVPRDDGSYVVSADWQGYTLLTTGLALLLFAIVTVRPLVPPEDGEESS